MGVCNCSMFCCTLHGVHSSNTIILMGKRELVALLNLSSWCLMMVERFFLAVPWGCLRFVIVVFPDHTHLLLESISTSVTILLKLNIVLRKRAKIRNQYNQAPHLPPGYQWESENVTIRHHKRLVCHIYNK